MSFISAVMLCASLSVTDCELVQDKKQVWPTEEACYQAADRVRPAAAAAGLTVIPLCFVIPGDPV